MFCFYKEKEGQRLGAGVGFRPCPRPIHPADAAVARLHVAAENHDRLPDGIALRDSLQRREGGRPRHRRVFPAPQNGRGSWGGRGEMSWVALLFKKKKKNARRRS